MRYPTDGSTQTQQRFCKLLRANVLKGKVHTVVDERTAGQLGSAFTPGTIAADHFEIKYFRAGQGQPIVILHHGSGPRFTLATDRLADRFDVVAFEMPGWGDKRNGRTETFMQLASTMAAAIETLHLQPCHLYGSSLGGAVATYLTAAHPGLVSRLVVESSAAFRVGYVYGRTNASSADHYAKAFRSQPDRPPRWQRPDPHASYVPLMSKLLAGPVYDESLARSLRLCSVPTLVLVGKDDGVIPPQNGRIYLDLMPNATLVEFDDAAHDIQGDRPEDLVEVVTQFLRAETIAQLPGTNLISSPSRKQSS